MVERANGNIPIEQQGRTTLGTRLRTFSHRHMQKRIASGMSLLSADAFLHAEPVQGSAEALLAVGSLVADRRTNEVRRKAQRDGIEVLGSKSSRRFTVLEVNEAADLLEEHLGITFTDERKPQVVDLHGKNRLVAMIDNPRIVLSKKLHTVYNSEYNTVFKRNDDLESLLTANMMGYIETTNPDFVTMEQEYDRAYIRMSEGKTSPKFDVEKYAVYKSFKYGLADFMACYALNRLIEQSKDEGNDWTAFTPPDLMKIIIDNSSLDQKEDKAKKNEQDYIVRGSEVLHNYIASLRELFYEKKKIFHRVSDPAPFSKAKNVGSIFFFHSILTLDSYDMELPEAIKKLVKNPPKSIEDIANPEEFVQNNF